MSSDQSLHHSRVEIPDPARRPNWVLYASHIQTVRLVVFVHGFGRNGRTVGAWNHFPQSGATNEWWRASDMLFVGYESLTEQPVDTAMWIRDRLAEFYPQLPSEYLRKRDGMVRAPSEESYQELVLVGHSLGGFVLRLAMCQQAKKWLYEDREHDPASARPPLLDAKLRLFSPASGGFEPAGLLGMAKASCLWTHAEVALRRSPAFTALEKGSELITGTRIETEELIDGHGAELAGLRAHIVWARPENIVAVHSYKRDYVSESLIPERNHSKVCKPDDTYEEPRRFVETGQHR